MAQFETFVVMNSKAPGFKEIRDRLYASMRQACSVENLAECEEPLVTSISQDDVVAENERLMEILDRNYIDY